MAHGSYESLVADPGVDVVYVATPHNDHFRHAVLGIEAGKHVLVKKPVGLDADEVNIRAIDPDRWRNPGADPFLTHVRDRPLVALDRGADARRSRHPGPDVPAPDDPELAAAGLSP